MGGNRELKERKRLDVWINQGIKYEGMYEFPDYILIISHERAVCGWWQSQQGYNLDVGENWVTSYNRVLLCRIHFLQWFSPTSIVSDDFE